MESEPRELTSDSANASSHANVIKPIQIGQEMLTNLGIIQPDIVIEK